VSLRARDPVAAVVRGGPVGQPATGQNHSTVLHVIRPGRGWSPIDVAELWKGRETLWFLVWRDLKVRYRQTALGVVWAFLQPLLAVAVFSVFFGRVAGMPSDGHPYPLFVLAAVIPWTLFARGLTMASTSLTANEELVRRVYFPRLYIPTASVSGGVADSMLSLGILAGMMGWYGIAPSPGWLLAPFFLVASALAALGTGLILAAINVRYRDVQQLVPFAVQLWLFASPVVYPSSLLSGPWRVVYGLNPMAGVIEGMRWSLLGGEAVSWGMIATSLTVIAVLLTAGAVIFRRAERTFADVI